MPGAASLFVRRPTSDAGKERVAQLVMATLWNRFPIWTDWVGASIAAVVVFNLNVTTSGDPLSGVGLSQGPTTAGITEGGRSAFYGSLAVGALLLTAAGFIIISMNGQRNRLLGGLVVRTYGGVALAGFLGLLLDYRDGPVRAVQLFVYLMLFLGALRLARIAALAFDDDANAQDEVNDDQVPLSGASNTRS